MNLAHATDLPGGLIALHLSVALDASGGPPREIKLFGLGRTKTQKGDVVYNAHAREVVKLAAETDGRDLLPTDIAHGMLNPFSPPQSHASVAWWRLDAREDGVYASDIDWTPEGAELLASRKFRFFSPAVSIDQKTRELTGVVNFALTNIPATRGQKPLVADITDHTDPVITHEGNPMLEEILKALGVKIEAEGLSRALRLSAFEQSFLAASGADSLVEAFSKIETWKTDSAKLVKLTADHEALKLAQTIDAKIVELSTAGKLPPGMHAFARKACKTVDELVELAATYEGGAAVIAGAGPTHAPTEQTLTLSAEHKAVAAALGITEAKMLERIKAEQEGRVA